MRSLFFLIISFSLLPITAFAEDGDTQQHGPHSHELGELNIVLEGSILQMELTLPGMAVVGFEHEPADDAERVRLSNMLMMLESHHAWFSFPVPALCGNAKNQVSLKSPGNEADETHSEFYVAYRFDCDRPDKLDSIEAKFVEILENLQKLNVQVVTPNSQKAVQLQPGNTHINIQ